MKFKHNKKRNTAFLFEALIKEMAKSVVADDGERQNKIARIIKRHFQKRGVLYKDLQTYRVLLELREAEESFARRILSEVRRDRDKINESKVFAAQSQLIRRINIELGKEVYSNFVPSYKNMATISQLFSDTSTPNEKVLLEDKILKEMTIAPDKTEKEIMEHVDSLVYNTFADKFNKEYSEKLHEEQREIVTKYIHSVSDNGLSLKSYLNEEIARLKERVSESLVSKEISSDDKMVESTKRVLEYLESLRETPLNDFVIKKIMQIQDLIREVNSDE